MKQQCLVGTSTQNGRFEFWWIGTGDWREEVEYEDVEIIDLTHVHSVNGKTFDKDCVAEVN